MEKYSFKCEFVPQKFSRNANKDNCLNWKCKIITDNGFYDFDYMQGIGHIPNYKKFNKAQIEEICNTGKYDKNFGKSFEILKSLDIPKNDDLLYGLFIDSNIPCDFEDFCLDFGYNIDSISDKKIFEDCIKTKKALLRLGFKLDDLALKFEDY